MSEPNPDLRRRRYRVRLRSLMLLVAVAAVTLGWRVNRAHTQARAVARIKEAGGHVWYDHELDGNLRPRANASPWAPVWLRRILGDEYFQTAISVTFSEQTTDDQLAPAEALDRLIEFNLDAGNNTKVTEVGLSHLRGLKNLRIVRIGNARVNDAVLGHLASLPRLQELFLLDVEGITDAGWANLAKMTELVDLTLGNTGITGAATRHLASLTRLQELDLFGSPITDSGLAWLDNLKALHTLSLSETGITDAGLAHLAGLSGLRELDLSYNSISSHGLRQLDALRQLRRLNLDDTGVSDEAIAELKAGFPRLVVSRETTSWTTWLKP